MKVVNLSDVTEEIEKTILDKGYKRMADIKLSRDYLGKGKTDNI